jgi:hypothetical protein
MDSATLRREILLEKARSDKEVVEIVNFMTENKGNIDTVLLNKLLSKVLPSRCAESIAPRFKTGFYLQKKKINNFKKY